MDEIWSIITIAIGAFLGIATMTNGAGAFGNMVGAALRGVFAHMAYVLPFYLILFGVLLFARKTSHFSLRTFLLLLVILLMLATMNAIRFLDTQKLELSLEVMKGFYTSGEQLLSGGFCGMLLADAFRALAGAGGMLDLLHCRGAGLSALFDQYADIRFFCKIAERVEARKLEKEHAHLDIEPEPQEGSQAGKDARRLAGTQMQMQLGEPPSSLAAAAQRTKEKREIKIINSSVLEEPKAEDMSASAGAAEKAVTDPPAQEQQSEVPETQMLFGSGAEAAAQASAQAQPPQPVPQKWWRFPKKSYVSPSQAADSAAKLPENSVLRYMSDDSLFEKQNENGIGLEEQREAQSRLWHRRRYARLRGDCCADLWHVGYRGDGSCGRNSRADRIGDYI